MTRVLVYGTSNYYGGIELFFMNLINNIDTAKITFDFVVSSDSPCPYEETVIRNHGKVFPVTSWGENAKKHKSDFLKVITNSHYDFVWANATSASNISIYPIVKKMKTTKLIIHSHGSAFETRNSGMKYKILKFLHRVNLPKINSFADYRFASSLKAGEWLFGNASVHVIKNGIHASKYLFDTHKRKEIREALEIENEFVLVTAGRLEEVKNYPYLLKVFQCLLKEKPNSTLLILGEGSYKVKLQTLAKELNIDHKVKFLGYVFDLASYFHASDAFILTSKSEGLSIVTIEAQATGLESYISDVVPTEVGITDLIHYLNINQPPEEWANSILSNEEKMNDRKKYVHQVKAKGYDIQSTVKEIGELLK